MAKLQKLTHLSKYYGFKRQPVTNTAIRCCSHFTNVTLSFSSISSSTESVVATSSSI